jgi:hypothetical protein
MQGPNELGRMLVGAGALLLAAGALVLLLGRFDVPLGRLPGDIHLRGRNWSFSFPIVTCLLASGVLSLVMWLLGRLRR